MTKASKVFAWIIIAVNFYFIYFTFLFLFDTDPWGFDELGLKLTVSIHLFLISAILTLLQRGNAFVLALINGIGAVWVTFWAYIFLMA